MIIDKKKLNALAALDDKTFEELIRQVVNAAGGTEAQAKSALSAAPMIRSKLKGASDREIDQMVGIVGEDKAREILGGLGLMKNE